ncbi:unnamed protein product, partial [Chrysoparadoxa australica]
FDFIVRHQRLHEPQACYLFEQLLDGVEYLHKNDVTHRDLKPENLLLQSSKGGWRLKIIDFGLSNTHEGGRLLETACGSPCYAAPEMIAGKKYVGPKADIWSMGVVLFTLVAGYLPFEDPNTSLLYKKILAGAYTCPKWLSAEAVELLHGILNTDPATRETIASIRKYRWFTSAAHAGKEVPASVIPTKAADVDSIALKTACQAVGGITEAEMTKSLLEG